MKLAPYPKYKDSGIEWLGKIPEGWSLKRLKYVCTNYAEYGLNIEAENYQTEGIRFIRTTDIDDYGNLKEEGVYLDESLAKQYVLNSEDLLISRSGTIGRTFLFDSNNNEKATFAGYLVRFSLDKKETFPKYIFYFTQSHAFFEWIRTQLVETTIRNVNAQKYANLFVTLPAIKHQTTIANFLDQKTATIDELIKKNEKLIELLKEKRQAIISHAVTKGLDPNAKMKDSGIEWLGEIPEGWSLKRLKYVAKIEMGQSPDSNYYNKDGGGVPFLQGNADFKEIYPEPQVWTTEGNKYSQKNDILISVRAPVGEINISDDRYAIGRGLVALRFNEKYDFKFYYYLFNRAKNYFDSVSTGTTYTSISTDDIENISVVVSPKDHQTTIANYLDQKTAQIDELVQKIQSQIETLKEYRQALISNIVTGKLRVN